MLSRLGTQNIRAERLVQMSVAYLREPPNAQDPRPKKAKIAPSTIPREDTTKTTVVPYPWTPISHLPGVGRYALDSYRIFCTLNADPSSADWESVLPTDKELIRYLKWRWAYFKRMEWDPSSGHVQHASVEYLQNIVKELNTNKR
jgi:methyl-CpG-binding domain protein 4